MKRTPLRDIFSLVWDSGDRWGSALSFHFGICETLYHADEEIPFAWQYRHGMIQDDLLDWPDVEIAELLDNGQVTADELRHFGNVLLRYEKLLEHRGESY